MADAIVSHKTCSACKLSKPLGEFSRSAAYKDGYRGQCKSCRSEYSKRYNLTAPKRTRAPIPLERLRLHKAKTKYGLSPDQFRALFDSHGGKCHICGTTKPGGRFDTFHIDHCHATGEVRGLLCATCNNILGKVGDSIERLTQCIAYLKDPPARKILTR